MHFTGQESRGDAASSGRTSNGVNTTPLPLDRQPIAIVRKGEEKLGLAVDAFTSTQEIVIKPLNKMVRENRYFAASSIIGTGEVVLILDVSNLILSKRPYPVSRES